MQGIESHQPFVQTFVCMQKTLTFVSLLVAGWRSVLGVNTKEIRGFVINLVRHKLCWRMKCYNSNSIISVQDFSDFLSQFYMKYPNVDIEAVFS